MTSRLPIAVWPIAVLKRPSLLGPPAKLFPSRRPQRELRHSDRPFRPPQPSCSQQHPQPEVLPSLFKPIRPIQHNSPLHNSHHQQLTSITSISHQHQDASKNSIFQSYSRSHWGCGGRRCRPPQSIKVPISDSHQSPASVTSISHQHQRLASITSIRNQHQEPRSITKINNQDQ
jgi:hypothetical protein